MLSALSKFKVIIFSFLFLLLTFNFLIITPAFALTTELQSPSSTHWNAILQTNFTGNSLLDMFSCWLSGFGLGKQGCVVDQINSDGVSSPKISYNGEGGGALGSVAMIMGNMYANPPTDTGYYLANLEKNFQITPAYAQQTNIVGSGVGIIQPVFQLWQVTRNLAYILFIIIIIAIGFMIMFRQRINAQTVVTVQLAIPQIVIGLIVVTFSYFIAAAVIDLAFLGTDLVVQLFNPANVGPNIFGDNTNQLQDLANNGNALRMFATAGLNGKALGTIAGGTIQQLLETLGLPVIGAVAAVGVIPLVAGFLTLSLPLILGGAAAVGAIVIVPAIVIVILLVALFIQMFRLVFALLMAYIQLLVLTVAGPLLILMGSVPGRSSNISFWFRGLLANTLVFPAVFATFLFAGLILGNTNGITTTLPLFGGVSTDFLKVLIAYGILLGSPAIPDMIRQAFKWQGPSGIANTATGAFLAGATVANVGRGSAINNFWRGGAKEGSPGAGPAARAFYRRFPGFQRTP